jgi:group I intron endonuclease
MKMNKGFGYKKSGIYCIRNITNNKVYIGSSTNIYYRLKRHISDLNRGVHCNPLLQNVYNKYGTDSFDVSIIEECDKDQVLIREQYYINTLSPEYNLTKEVINNKLSAESRKKISDTMKAKSKAGIRVNPLNENKQKKINLYDCNCKFIKQFNSYNDAGRFIKTKYPMFTPDSVSTIVKSKFGRYKDYFLISPEKSCNSDISKEGYNIVITNLITESVHSFKSIKQASKYLFCAPSDVSRAIINNRPLLKKYSVKKI